MNEAVNTLLTLARSQIGYREGPNNYTKYADDPKIAKLYGWVPQNQPWCCTYANWCYLNAFGYDIGSCLTYGGTAACANSAQLFANNGAFVRTPEIGDQAFFYANGGVNHTGIVVEVTGNTFQTVEGNYSDKVSLVNHRIGSSDVAGFGRPCWNILEGDSSSSTENPEKSPLITLRNGSTGDAVVLLQAALNLRGYNCGRADGEIGPATIAALNRYKQSVGLPADGVCDADTWGKILDFGEGDKMGSEQPSGILTASDTAFIVTLRDGTQKTVVASSFSDCLRQCGEEKVEKIAKLHEQPSNMDRDDLPIVIKEM